MGSGPLEKDLKLVHRVLTLGRFGLKLSTKSGLEKGVNPFYKIELNLPIKPLFRWSKDLSLGKNFSEPPPFL